MAAVYLIGVLFILGLTQANPAPPVNQHAIIENLRNAGGQRVVAGWEAEDGQIPHQVNVRMINAIGGVATCGGSIIHHSWILTAAHCLANRFSFVVRIGLTNLTRPEYLVDSTNKFIHPQYIEILAGVQTADIALLGLDYHIPYGPYIQPCRLQNSETRNVNYAGVRLTVSGYGLTDDSINGGTTSQILRWVYLLGITNAECLSWYTGSSVIRDETICAAYYNDTAQSSCSGDSGGPLTIVDNDGSPTMVGVVSFGHVSGCNSPYPAGFVRPGHYHQWFLDVTGINFDWNQNDIQRQNTLNERPIVV